MRLLTKGGAYSKNNILDMSYFSSENKINMSKYKINIRGHHVYKSVSKPEKGENQIAIKTIVMKLPCMTIMLLEYINKKKIPH